MKEYPRALATAGGAQVRLWRPSDWDSDIVPTLKRLAQPRVPQGPRPDRPSTSAGVL